MNKDISIIPGGMYCYSYKGGQQYLCPYFVIKNILGVKVPWCNFLDKGSVDNQTTDAEYQRLLAYYGSEEELYQDLPLMILWDQVKECRINEAEIDDGGCDDDCQSPARKEDDLDQIEKQYRSVADVHSDFIEPNGDVGIELDDEEDISVAEKLLAQIQEQLDAINRSDKKDVDP